MAPKKVALLIPARFQSTRFPGKPLAVIHGKSLIQRVYEKCSKVLSENIIFSPYVVTDNQKIYDHVSSFGNVLRIDDEVESGTERIFLAYHRFLRKENFDLIINVQGDEPLVNPQDIFNLANFHLNSSFPIATLIKKMLGQKEDFKNSNKVKVVWSEKTQECLYFSRSPIPFDRNSALRLEWNLHIGIYSFFIQALESFCSCDISFHEKKERLEQLRALDNGFKIGAIQTDSSYIGVDHPDDIQVVEEFLSEHKAER